LGFQPARFLFIVCGNILATPVVFQKPLQFHHPKIYGHSYGGLGVSLWLWQKYLDESGIWYVNGGDREGGFA
jgi:hypothetical protein